VSEPSANHPDTRSLPPEQPQDSTLLAQQAAPVETPKRLRASLVVLSGWEIGHEFDVNDCPKVLGRSTQADVYVNAPSVSRQHARFDRLRENDEEYFTITDLGSSNGTQVNETPVVSTRLKHGDRVRTGDVVFRFVLQDDLDAAFLHEVHQLIHYDQLTGLLTMDAFKRRLETIMRRSHPRACFTLAMTDLDGLKRVNDTHGHLAGRMTVREMGVMMRQCIRTQDLAGLYGGDEAIVLFQDASLEEAKQVAEKLRLTIEQRQFEHQGNTFRVTISQGLAEWPRHATTMEALIAAADKALYAAKSAGRNCIRTADDA
jgi:two-component system, cell cycle response regulator